MVRPEDRFRQWRDAGDAEALAEVYDLAAPTLLRLALHHVRHPASAEDLVQATFLAAIQNAGSYDPQRPLLAWLVGILHNQAKWLQRREGRAVDATRLADRAEHDPLAAAQTAEFAAQCDEAIEGLPDVYRPVLRLHLKHQLAAAEIAHVLGRPPGTVRSQVARGLELLRAALPAGIALAAFAVLTPGRGLAAVRDVVLAAGGARTASVLVAAAETGAVILGGVTMKKAMLGVVVLLGLSAGSWWAFGGSVDPVLVAPQAPTVETAKTRTAAEANATAAPAPPELSREAAAASAPSWRLVGRVFDAEGAPVGDASVRVRLQFDHEGEPLADASTGEDGRYTVDLEALRALPPIDLGRAQLSLTVHAPGRRATGQVTLPHRDPTQSLLALGDAQLVAAAIVSGRVVDADGIPVAGASVHLGPKASGASGPNDSATSDASGRYLMAAMQPAEARVDAGHTRVGRAETQCTLVPGGETTLPDLRLQASSTLRARVVFADGEPAARLGMQIYEPDNHSQTAAIAQTDDDGYLVVRTLPPGPYDARIGWIDHSIPATRVATGEENPTIVLGDVHELRFSFRDEAGRSLRPMDVGIDIWPASSQAAAAFAAGAPLTAELEHDYPSVAGWISSLVVARGTWVRVKADHDSAHAEVIVQATPPRNVLETVLTLRERARDATLLLQLTTPDGSDLGDVKVRLRQLYLGEPGSYDLELEPNGSSRFVRWFPGRYCLEVAPKGNEARMDCGWFAPFERDVQLRRGETTTVDATVHAGGRVRFHLHTPEPRAREEVVDFAVETPAATGPAGQRRRVFIETTPHGWRSGGSPPAGVPLLWPPVLPPGHHVLAIRSRDYADTSVAAVVTARAVTDVHVWLQPR